jgi:hypothetical protein
VTAKRKALEHVPELGFFHRVAGCSLDADGEKEGDADELVDELHDDGERRVGIWLFQRCRSFLFV